MDAVAEVGELVAQLLLGQFPQGVVGEPVQLLGALGMIFGGNGIQAPAECAAEQASRPWLAGLGQLEELAQGQPVPGSRDVANNVGLELVTVLEQARQLQLRLGGDVLGVRRGGKFPHRAGAQRMVIGNIARHTGLPSAGHEDAHARWRPTGQQRRDAWRSGWQRSLILVEAVDEQQQPVAQFVRCRGRHFKQPPVLPVPHGRRGQLGRLPGDHGELLYQRLLESAAVLLPGPPPDEK